MANSLSKFKVILPIPQRDLGSSKFSHSIPIFNFGTSGGYQFNPIDGATYYFGMTTHLPDSIGKHKIYIRKAGTIKIAEINSYAGGTAGTNENISLYINLNGSSDTLIATVGLAAAERDFTNSALSIAVVAGDYFEIKMVCPTWATNPSYVCFGGYIYIE